jgi:hypothetical protein
MLLITQVINMADIINKSWGEFIVNDKGEEEELLHIPQFTVGFDDSKPPNPISDLQFMLNIYKDLPELFDENTQSSKMIRDTRRIIQKQVIEYAVLYHAHDMAEKSREAKLSQQLHKNGTEKR